MREIKNKRKVRQVKRPCWAIQGENWAKLEGHWASQSDL